jgi:hypothetical protein
VRANREDIRFDEFVEAVRLNFANVSDRTSFGLGPYTDTTLRNERLRNATTPLVLKDGADWASDNGLLSLVPSIALDKLNADATTNAPNAGTISTQSIWAGSGFVPCPANEARIAVTFGQREGAITAYR